MWTLIFTALKPLIPGLISAIVGHLTSKVSLGSAAVIVADLTNNGHPTIATAAAVLAKGIAQGLSDHGKNAAK